MSKSSDRKQIKNIHNKLHPRLACLKDQSLCGIYLPKSNGTAQTQHSWNTIINDKIGMRKFLQKSHNDKEDTIINALSPSTLYVPRIFKTAKMAVVSPFLSDLHALLEQFYQLLGG
ncbi:hypothetical protein CEXT_370021 [Caerostris extrusa]|uniref:Uncharacterized protein n=1 Tax=Caerostris extrusa TaxID=172846 RepID=A0AAV4VIS9_CAEEX|nr:hypothetical protein CEXT_370021 [Caerostris extrusa]